MIKDHKPLQDPEVLDCLFRHIPCIKGPDVDLMSWSTADHIAVYETWINNNRFCTIRGLDLFPVKALASGTSQAIENFVVRNNRRRLRFSRSEFVLSRIVCNANKIAWKFLEDGELEPTDALVLSWPFSGNGDCYPDLRSLLTICDSLGIPVLIDCAYFGISYDMEIDVSNPCITDVVTSISKPFSTMLRHGIRFTKLPYDDCVQNNSDTGVLSRLATVAATHLLRNFSAEFIITKYKDKQIEICQELGLQPTKTITLALGDDDKHKEFKRGDYTRICLTDELLA